jgi:hypothetical protein
MSTGLSHPEAINEWKIKMHRLEETFSIGSFSGFWQYFAAIIIFIRHHLTFLLVWILHLVGMYEAETYPLSVKIRRNLDDSEYNTEAHLSNHTSNVPRFRFRIYI